MADFAEHFKVVQLDPMTYSFCWAQIDLADMDVKDWEVVNQGSEEDLYDFLERHMVDAERIFSHFEDYPCSILRFVEEY